MAPSKTKPSQAKPNKNAWFCLVLFVRIGTFQWVTAIPNKKIRLRLRMCAKCLKPIPHSPFSSPDAWRGAGLIRRIGKRIARILDFAKRLSVEKIAGWRGPAAEASISRFPGDLWRYLPLPFRVCRRVKTDRLGRRSPASDRGAYEPAGRHRTRPSVACPLHHPMDRGPLRFINISE